MAANIHSLFHHHILSLFPPASGRSPATDWRPIKVVHLYAEETKPREPGMAQEVTHFCGEGLPILGHISIVEYQMNIRT